MAESSFLRRRADGVEIAVRLTPRSSKDAIEGIETAADGRSHLTARVRAVPEKGKANQALIQLVAKELGLPVGAVEIASGGTARLKIVGVTGDPATIETRLAVLTAVSCN